MQNGVVTPGVAKKLIAAGITGRIMVRAVPRPRALHHLHHARLKSSKACRAAPFCCACCGLAARSGRLLRMMWTCRTVTARTLEHRGRSHPSSSSKSGSRWAKLLNSPTAAITSWCGRHQIISTRILGRRTAPFTPFLIPNRVTHGVTARS